MNNAGSAFGRSSIPRSSLCQALCGKNRRRRVPPVPSWEFELRRVPRSLLETHAATPSAPSGKHPAVRYESSAPSLATFRSRPTPQSKKHCAERGNTPHTTRPSPPLRATNALKTRASKPLIPLAACAAGTGGFGSGLSPVRRKSVSSASVAALLVPATAANDDAGHSG
jgi:hypothetical protein